MSFRSTIKEMIHRIWREKRWSLPKEGVDQHGSGPVIHRSRQLCLCFWDVSRCLLGCKECVEENKPGGREAKTSTEVFLSPKRLRLQQGLTSDCPHLARSMTRSSCLFTWWLSMMEQSRATSHFLRRKMEASALRKRGGEANPMNHHGRVLPAGRLPPAPASQYSLLLSVLPGLLLASAEVQQRFQLRLQEGRLEPLHVLPQGVGLEVLHHPPHWRHHWVTLVGQRGEAHHHRQLLLHVRAALQEVRHKDFHLRGQLKAVGLLQRDNDCH